MTQQKTVICKSCHRKLLVPAADTSRQEIAYDIGNSAFALICPFCMTHSTYTAYDLE